MKMNPPAMTLLFLFLLATGFLAACNLPLTKLSTRVPARAVTAAAETVAVLRTQFAATSTADSPTPSAHPTELISSTLPAIPCDRASLFAETVPDDTPIAKGTAFTKIWTLKNTGTCTWNSSYALIFVKGDAMGGEPKPLPFTGVAPGEIIQVSLDLHAPLAGTSAKGEWMLSNASGVLFGLGPDGNQTFWVQIKIME